LHVGLSDDFLPGLLAGEWEKKPVFLPASKEVLLPARSRRLKMSYVRHVQNGFAPHTGEALHRGVGVGYVQKWTSVQSGADAPVFLHDAEEERFPVR